MILDVARCYLWLLTLHINIKIGINMASLSYNKETEIIRAFNSTSRYLDDLLNIDNPFFEGRIYPPELQLKLRHLLPKPHFFYLQLSI